MPHLLMWLGAAVGLGFVPPACAHGLSWVDQVERRTYDLATLLLLYGALLLVGIGAAVRVSYCARGYLRHYLGYHRLHGLWNTLTSAFPDAVLESPPPLPIGLVPIRSTQLRLYRRAVEIRDAQLELTTHVPQASRDAAALALADEPRLALDACVLLMALRHANTPTVKAAAHGLIPA